MPKGKAFRRSLRLTSLFLGSKGFARIFVAQDLRNLLQGSEVRSQLNPLFLLQLLLGHHLLVLVSPQLPRAVFEGEGLTPVFFLGPCLRWTLLTVQLLLLFLPLLGGLLLRLRRPELMLLNCGVRQDS